MNAYAPFRYACAHSVHTLVLVFTAMLGLTSLHPATTAEANLFLAEPLHGSFTTAPQTVASGRVEVPDLSTAILTVNGTVVALAPDGSFSHPVALDAARIFNPVLVELTSAGHVLARQRPVVIVGASLPETALAPESLAVRLTDRGLDQLELLVVRSVDLDAARFLPPGPLFSEEVCMDIPLLPDICTDVDVTILDNPAPSFGAVAVNFDAIPDQVNFALTLQNLFVRAEAEADGVSCTITVTADSMLVNGAIGLEPHAANPAAIDVVQVGGLTTTFGNFNDDTDCGGVLGDVGEELIPLLVGNIRERLQNGLENFLNTADASGNTPLAGILEEVLGRLSLDTAINAAIAEDGLRAHLPFSRISEDHDGITFVMDTAVDILPEGPCTTSQENPALAAVYDVPRLLPPLGSITPGGLLFDVGGMMSATVLNQALRGGTACGHLQAELTEIDMNGEIVPITAGLLTTFLPAFAQFDPALPLRMVLRPTLAPVVSGTLGPVGELIDLRVSTYLVELFTLDNTSPLMQLALDLRAGLDLQLDPATGAVRPYIGTITDWVATLLHNPLGVDPARIDVFVAELLPNMGDLNNQLEPLSIPTIEGFDFKIVEVGRMDTYLNTFLDLIPPP